MDKFTPDQQKRLQKLIGLLSKNESEMILHIVDLEDKFDMAMEIIEKAMPSFKAALDNIESIRPKKGSDYPDESQVRAVIEEMVSALPKPKDADEEKITKKVIAEVTRQIRIPKDGADAIVDYDSIISSVMSQIKLPKDGSPDTGDEIIAKINESEEQINADRIRDLPKEKNIVSAIEATLQNRTQLLVQMIGGVKTRLDTLEASSATLANSILTATGTIDDSNVAFVFTRKPSVIIHNGIAIIETGGSITWSWNAGASTATLSSPVGTGGSIFGLK
jgi:hypothetical protein